MATTEDGIWTPDQVDDYNLVSDLATTASTVQDALDKRANTYRGTSTQRNSFTSSAPEGTIWVDTNGSKEVWVKQGNSWKKIYPSGFSRRVFTGSSVLSVASGGSLVEAFAIRDEFEGTDYASVSVQFRVSGISRPSGTGSTELGTLSSQLRPAMTASAAGLLQPGALTIQILSSGLVSVRWAYAAGSGSIYVTSSFPSNT